MYSTSSCALRLIQMLFSAEEGWKRVRAAIKKIERKSFFLECWVYFVFYYMLSSTTGSIKKKIRACYRYICKAQPFFSICVWLMAIQTCILLHSWLKYSIIEHRKKGLTSKPNCTLERTYMCIHTYRKQMLEQMRTVYICRHNVYTHPPSKHFSLSLSSALENDALSKAHSNQRYFIICYDDVK